MVGMSGNRLSGRPLRESSRVFLETLTGSRGAVGEKEGEEEVGGEEEEEVEDGSEAEPDSRLVQVFFSEFGSVILIT